MTEIVSDNCLEIVTQCIKYATIQALAKLEDYKRNGKVVGIARHLQQKIKPKLGQLCWQLRFANLAIGEVQFLNADAGAVGLPETHTMLIGADVYHPPPTPHLPNQALLAADFPPSVAAVCLSHLFTTRSHLISRQRIDAAEDKRFPLGFSSSTSL